MEIERIELEADTPAHDFSLRVIRFRGTGNGPSTYIQAALHGHELPGMVALDRLIPHLMSAEGEGRIAGDITLVPQANPLGLAQALFGETLGRFDFHGRTNFNRSFPTGAADRMNGRPADERLKALLLSLAAPADIVLDLHCDDEGPVYLYVAESQLEEGRRLARALDAAVILTDQGTDPVSFDTSVAARWDAEGRADDARFSATVELRGMLDVSPAFAEADAGGIYRYLVEAGAVVDALPAKASLEPVIGDIDAAELIPTPVPGAVLYDVSVGDWVSEGQRLAMVLGEAGTDPHEGGVRPMRTSLRLAVNVGLQAAPS